MADRLSGMEVFVRVAALGSLSAAARALGMSQTMATKHVAALEGRLGVKLLHRTTRQMTLTEAGRNYLDAVEVILEDIAEADAHAARSVTEVSGQLRLNVPVSFGIREIAPLLPKLAQVYPKLTVELGLNDRHVNLIEEGWDLVIRIGRMKDSSMVARKLAPCAMVVCASPKYLEENNTPRRVSDLSEHNCLGYTLSGEMGVNRWSFGRDGKTRVSVSGGLSANNGDALAAAAVGGEGIVYLPMFLVHKDIKSGALEQIELDQPTRQLDGVYAVYPADRKPPAKVRSTIEFFADHFSPIPPWEFS